LNETHQFLACTGDVNVLGGSINTIKKNAEALFKGGASRSKHRGN